MGLRSVSVFLLFTYFLMFGFCFLFLLLSEKDLLGVWRLEF